MASVPESMSAIEIAQAGGPDVLRLMRLPTPQPSAGQILVKVAAAGVNRPDIAQRMGLYPHRPAIRRCRAWRSPARLRPWEAV